MNMRVRFSEVRVGDKIYDPGYYAPYKWRTVTAIEPSGTDTLALVVGQPIPHQVVDTRTRNYGHKDEGITGLRDD